MVGSAVSPLDRVPHLVATHFVTVLKAGSTFLRMLMSLPDAADLMSKHDLRSLTLGAFCAEPVNEAVHQFATQNLTPNYINCYWATEHGGIVFGVEYLAGRAMVPDARTWALPWVEADVMVESDDGSWRVAADGEQGDIVICNRMPYSALTVWASAGYGSPGWQGEAKRWRSYFHTQPGARGDLMFLQGDSARRLHDGGYKFSGRTDEVINVGGNRIGTGEI